LEGIMGDTVSLNDFGSTIRKRWKLIVFTTMSATLISVILSYFVLTPIFQATTQILVNQKNSENQVDISLMQNNVDLISTYASIIKSPAILEIVIDKLDLKQSEEQLNQNIKITNQENSQVFYLIVENADAEMAIEIANTVSRTFQEEIQEIMNVNNVSILATAKKKENPIPVKPNKVFNIAIGMVLGLMVGMLVAFLLELMDKSLKGDHDIEIILGLPVLGSIPNMTQEQNTNKKEYKKEKMGGETIVS
jgi:capsular polysaccharide biosynthesis protein